MVLSNSLANLNTKPNQNKLKVIEIVPSEDRVPGLEIQNGRLPSLTTLGVSWHTEIPLSSSRNYALIGAGNEARRPKQHRQVKKN